VSIDTRASELYCAHAHFGVIMPEAAVADDWCRGAEADGEAIAGDGRCSTQGAVEY